MLSFLFFSPSPLLRIMRAILFFFFFSFSSSFTECYICETFFFSPGSEYYLWGVGGWVVGKTLN